MRIQLATFDNCAVFELLSNGSSSMGQMTELAPGIVARLESSYNRKAVGFPSVIDRRSETDADFWESTLREFDNAQKRGQKKKGQ